MGFIPTRGHVVFLIPTFLGAFEAFHRDKIRTFFSRKSRQDSSEEVKYCTKKDSILSERATAMRQSRIDLHQEVRRRDKRSRTQRKHNDMCCASGHWNFVLLQYTVSKRKKHHALHQPLTPPMRQMLFYFQFSLGNQNFKI